MISKLFGATIAHHSSTHPYSTHLAIALISGAMMGCTPAPVNAWFLAWVALAPLWVLMATARYKPVANSFLGLAWGIGYHGLALSWITGLHPLTWMGVPWLGSIAIAAFCWVFITLWGAAIVAVWAGGVAGLNLLFLKRRSQPLPVWLRVLLGTALWCGLEAFWSLGALWWTSLSYTQSPHNLAILHLGQFSGATAVTGAIVAVNGLLAEAWIARSQQARSKFQNLLIAALALLIGLHLLGFWLYSRPIAQPSESALRVGIIQGNIPTRIKLFEDGLKRSIAAYTNGYQALADRGVDAVLTPEGALPWLWVGTPAQAKNPLYQAIQNRGITTWVGTAGTKTNGITWSLFTITGTGEVVGRYDKIKLVPLGEYIPFRSILGSLVSRLSPTDASMSPGSFHQQFDTPFGRAIGGICYDSAFPRSFRAQAAAGGQFILTASNNDPYSTAMMAQHHAQDVMRAIETDRWAARATNTGYSGIVDPHGKTLWRSQANVYELHDDTIYRRQTQTLYVRWGDWLLSLLGAGAIGFLVRQYAIGSIQQPDRP